MFWIQSYIFSDILMMSIKLLIQSILTQKIIVFVVIGIIKQKLILKIN